LVCAGEVAEIGVVGVSLEVAEADPGGGEFGLEGVVGVGFLGEVLEILDGFGGEEPTGGCGSGQGGDGVVDFEEEGISDLADFFKTARGEVALGTGGVGLAGGDEAEQEDEAEGGGDGGGEGAVAGEEEADAVGGMIGDSGDGLASEVAADVVGELGGGLVAVLGVAAEGFEDDGVDFASEFASEGGW